jgi:hypothetical protein
MKQKLENLFINVFGSIAAYAFCIGLTLLSLGFGIWSVKWVCSLLGLFGL